MEESQNKDTVRVVLPEESFTVIEWEEKDLPCIAILNSGLQGFEHKNIFAWHLSVVINFDDLIDNGMPSLEEREVVEPFCDELDEDIKAGGNALLFARETWNETREIIWRVYDPDIAHKHLQYLVDYKRHPRQFEWKMEHDPQWERTDWYFKQIKT